MIIQTISGNVVVDNIATDFWQSSLSKESYMAKLYSHEVVAIWPDASNHTASYLWAYDYIATCGLAI